MKTIWQRDPREELVARLTHLTASALPRFGRFSAPKMLAHVNDGLRMSLGELRCAPRRGPLRYAPLRQLVIYAMPWPRGAPTAPELIARAPDEWDEEVRAFGALLERFAARASDQPYPVHPAFGAISGKDWGALEFRHIDHHFTQFGA
jgi:hypothetical protein